MKKIVLIAVPILILGLLSAFFAARSLEDCREIAFRQSEFYGSIPRRYFEVSDLPDSRSLWSLSYFVSFYCQPKAVLEVSRFSCGLKSARQPAEVEAQGLLALVKGCQGPVSSPRKNQEAR